MGTEFYAGTTARTSSYPLPQKPTEMNNPKYSPQYGALTLSMRQQDNHNTSKKGNVQKFAGLAVGISSVVAEHVISHPCVVLRRQCQVHHDSRWAHVTPFTLLPIIYNIQRHQSVTTLWKGITSSFLVKGLTVATESAISELTPLPKEVNRHSTLKKLLQHLLLKGMAVVVVLPFYASSLVETVQSEVASERPGILDCLREGLSRLFGWGTMPTTRLLPLWRMVPLMVLYGVSHYTIMSLAEYTVMLSIRTEMLEAQEQQSSLLANLPGPTSRTEAVHVHDKAAAPQWYEAYNAQLLASFTGRLLADTILYPLETVMHRLLLQGTRTIIDNTDSGLDVVPVITRYHGTIDCCRGILVNEGFSGFYRGLGALLLQYALHGAILKVTELILLRVGQSSEQIDVEAYRRHFDTQSMSGDGRKYAQRQLNMHASNVLRDPGNMPSSSVLRDPRLDRISGKM